MSFLRIKLSIGVATLLAGASIAHAVPTPLTWRRRPQRLSGHRARAPHASSPARNCKNPDGFSFTNFQQGGNISAYDEDSPIYSISQFPSLSFDVAVDVNMNSDASETLRLFSVFVDADGAGAGGFEEIYNFTGPEIIGTGSSNGNGFADWTLGSVDLSTFASDALVYFNAVWDGAVAGAESFFLVDREATPVREPGTLILMGLGLLGLGLAHRRRPQVRS